MNAPLCHWCDGALDGGHNWHDCATRLHAAVEHLRFVLVSVLLDIDEWKNGAPGGSWAVVERVEQRVRTELERPGLEGEITAAELRRHPESTAIVRGNADAPAYSSQVEPAAPEGVVSSDLRSEAARPKRSIDPHILGGQLAIAAERGDWRMVDNVRHDLLDEPATADASSDAEFHAWEKDAKAFLKEAFGDPPEGISLPTLGAVDAFVDRWLEPTDDETVMRRDLSGIVGASHREGVAEALLKLQRRERDQPCSTTAAASGSSSGGGGGEASTASPVPTSSSGSARNAGLAMCLHCGQTPCIIGQERRIEERLVVTDLCDILGTRHSTGLGSLPAASRILHGIRRAVNFIEGYQVFDLKVITPASADSSRKADGVRVKLAIDEWCDAHGVAARAEGFENPHDDFIDLLAGILADVRRETIEACAGAADAHGAYFAEDSGAVTKEERGLIVGAARAIAQDIRSLRFTRPDQEPER